MARKRYNEEDILRLLREIEVHLHGGMDVVSACRSAGISDKTYYGWRKRYGGMGRAKYYSCLLYTSPSPRDLSTSRMPSSA